MEDTLVKDLEAFLGGRFLPAHLRKYLLSLKKPLDKVLHRGMNYPIHLIKEGEVLDEWHGSTHWSKEFQVAHDFAFDGYLNDDYLDELESRPDIMEAHQVTNVEDLFRPVIFRLKENTQAIDISGLIEGVEELNTWTKEQEVNFIGVDFVIESYKLIEGEKPYYLIDVKELERVTA